MKLQTRLVPLILFSLLISSSPSCKRKPPSLEAIDKIDRRSNLPMVEPISRDLAEIRKRGSLTVLAPYNSTTYFIYQGEPAGYEYELLGAFAKDLGVALKMVVVTDPKSLFPLLNSGEGDIAAARLIPPVGPTTALEDQSPVSFSRRFTAPRRCWCNRTSLRPRPAKGRRKRWHPGLLINCRRWIFRRDW